MNKWNIVLLLIFFICLILLTLLLGGCSMAKQAQDLDIIWHDGKCLLIADGMTVQQAREMSADWNFKECDISVSGKQD